MAQIATYKYFAGGSWHEAAGGQYFDDHEPFTGQVLARVAAGGRKETELAIQAVASAFPAWSETSPGERARLFRKAAEIVRHRRAAIADLLARETGSTIFFAAFQQEL